MENISNYPNTHKIRTQVVDDFVGNMINTLSNISDYYIFFNTAIDIISKIPGSKFHVYPKPITENPDGNTPKEKEILLFHKTLSDYKERQAKKLISTHQIQFGHKSIEPQNGLFITMESGYKLGFLEIPGYSDWTERFAQNRHRLIASIQKQVAQTIGSRITQCNMMLCLKLAQYDSLTGLHTRGYGRDLIHGSIESQRNKGGSLGCFMFMDIDNFKSINDQCGHIGGDRVLQGIAHIFKELIKQPNASNFILVRYGGEEFIIFCPGKTAEETMPYASALNKSIEKYKFELPPHLIGNNLKRRIITASIGVTDLSEISPKLKTDKIMDEGIERADMAMYYVKKVLGKNDTHLFDEVARTYAELAKKDPNTRP